MTDFWTTLAARIFKVPRAAVTASQRRQAKSAGHMYIYGGDPETLVGRKRLDAELRSRGAATHKPAKGPGSYSRKPKHGGKDHD
jgi:hypothetical protein